MTPTAVESIRVRLNPVSSKQLSELMEYHSERNPTHYLNQVIELLHKQAFDYNGKKKVTYNLNDSPSREVNNNNGSTSKQ